MSARIFRAFVLLALLSSPAAALADQTFHLKGTPKILTFDTDGLKKLDYLTANALVKKVFSDDAVNDPDFYCVIHILTWGENPETVDSNSWFLYRGKGSRHTAGGPWTDKRFTGSRILGSDTLRVLYVHLNVPAVQAPQVQAARAATLANLKAAAAKEPENVTLAGLVAKFDQQGTFSMRGKPLVQIKDTDMFVEQDYLGVSYQVDAVAKLPAPIQNLKDVIGMLQADEIEETKVATDKTVTLYNAAAFGLIDVPSDVTITGKLSFGASLATTTTSLGTKTYDNEGLYRWDVSLGIPMTSVSQVDFEASGGEVFAKDVDTAKLLVMLNLYIMPVDTKDTKKLLFPRPLVGVALSTKPLEKIFVGGSMGLNRVQVFADFSGPKSKTRPKQ